MHSPRAWSVQRFAQSLPATAGGESQRARRDALRTAHATKLVAQAFNKRQTISRRFQPKCGTAGLEAVANSVFQLPHAQRSQQKPRSQEGMDRVLRRPVRRHQFRRDFPLTGDRFSSARLAAGRGVNRGSVLELQNVIAAAGFARHRKTVWKVVRRATIFP
jgi:nitrogen fixation protein FixH